MPGPASCLSLAVVFLPFSAYLPARPLGALCTALLLRSPPNAGARWVGLGCARGPTPLPGRSGRSGEGGIPPGGPIRRIRRGSIAPPGGRTPGGRHPDPQEAAVHVCTLPGGRRRDEKGRETRGLDHLAVSAAPRSPLRLRGAGAVLRPARESGALERTALALGDCRPPERRLCARSGRLWRQAREGAHVGWELNLAVATIGPDRWCICANVHEFFGDCTILVGASVLQGRSSQQRAAEHLPERVS